MRAMLRKVIVAMRNQTSNNGKVLWTNGKLAIFAALAEGRLKCVNGGGAGDQEQIALSAIE